MFASLDRLAKEGWRFEIEHQPNDGFYISAIKADFNETPALNGFDSESLKMAVLQLVEKIRALQSA